MGYRATRDGGEMIVHRVPIFCACARGDVEFDDEWIAAAVAKARQSEREGYFPPLHIRHHEPATDATDAVRAAGYFRILGTASITFKGSRRTAVMADLIITDPETQREVLAKRLPYRSVEIFNVDKPSLDGLALLDHEAPFLELPMLMVSDVDGQLPTSSHAQGDVAPAIFQKSWQMDAHTKESPVVACFRHGDHAHLLFREENHMMTPEQMVAEEVEAERVARFQDNGDEPKKKDEEAKKKNYQDNGDEDKDEDMQDEGLDVAGVVKAIESGEISVADMDAILVAIQSSRTEEAPEEEAAPAPAPVPGAEAMRGSMTEKFAHLHGENQALRADMNSLKAAEERKEQVRDALLRLEGRPLGADLEERLVAFHADHGPKAFQAYIDGLAKTTGVLPGEDGKGEAFHGQATRVSDAAMKYQTNGTDAVDQAHTFALEWETLKETGHTRMSQERYIDINMAKVGN